MRLSVRLLIAGITMLTPLMLAPAAIADDPDVQRRGACGRSSHWELDLEREHGGLKVDFEVDQGVVGDDWAVTLRHDGDVFFRGTRTTHGDDGSFDVERHVNDRSGTDRFIGRAVNRSTGEICRGTAAI